MQALCVQQTSIEDNYKSKARVDFGKNDHPATNYYATRL